MELCNTQALYRVTLSNYIQTRKRDDFWQNILFTLHTFNLQTDKNRQEHA